MSVVDNDIAVLGLDFRFRDDLSKDDPQGTVAIEVLKSEYKGVIFRFTRVSIREEGQVARFRWEYEFIQAPGHSMKKLRDDTTFNKFLGFILRTIVEQIAQGMPPDDEDRTDYFEEPVAERTVHEEGSPVPQG